MCESGSSHEGFPSKRKMRKPETMKNGQIKLGKNTHI